GKPSFSYLKRIKSGLVNLTNARIYLSFWGTLMAFLTPKVSNATPPAWFLAHYWDAKNSKEEGEYYAAFGKFIAAFALAEAGVHIAVRHFSGMSDAKARITFGGAPTSVLTWNLRQFTKGTEHSEETETLLAQLDAISDVRNKFVHQ